MATSSDWIGALAEPAAGADAPGWLALLEDGRTGFQDASPFSVAEPNTPALIDTSAPAPDAPDPGPGPDTQAAALAKAHADGVAQGRAAAEAQSAALGARQRALRLTFRALDEAALGVLADDLAATVMALCDGVLCDAAVDCEGLLARCHASARRIGGAADTLTLHLHPDDMALLGEASLAGWRAAPDPSLERGSVVIEGADGSVSDGPAEWRRAIAAAVRG